MHESKAAERKPVSVIRWNKFKQRLLLSMEILEKIFRVFKRSQKFVAFQKTAAREPASRVGRNFDIKIITKFNKQRTRNFVIWKKIDKLHPSNQSLNDKFDRFKAIYHFCWTNLCITHHHVIHKQSFLNWLNALQNHSKSTAFMYPLNFNIPTMLNNKSQPPPPPHPLQVPVCEHNEIALQKVSFFTFFLSKRFFV